MSDVLLPEDPWPRPWQASESGPSVYVTAANGVVVCEVESPGPTRGSSRDARRAAAVRIAEAVNAAEAAS